MTADSAMLLKMLEPVVRPGQAGGPSRRPVAPLEQQSFESLLDNLQIQIQATDQSEQSAAGAQDEQGSVSKTSGLNPLSDLARVDQIQNASLRSLIARAAPQSDGEVER